MGNSNTPGPDFIPPKLFQNINYKQQNDLLNILNSYWNTGLPTQWKKSTIIPILKSNKPPNIASSYRPISLTNSLCKTMERLVNLRLKLFLTDHNIQDPNQSGFRPGLSSLDGVSRLENRIRIDQVENRATLAIFLDLNQAFDSLNINLLMQKVQRIKINGNLACFIKDFLEIRTLTVRNGNKYSTSHPLQSGIPQGSVISPSLFNIYINDLLKDFSPNVMYSKFADDLAFWVSDTKPINCIIKAQNTLNYIEDWITQNGLSLSASKSKAIFFTKKRKPNTQLTLYSSQIEFVNEHKFLCLILDRSLSWKPQITNLKIRCNADLRLMKLISGQKCGEDMLTLRKLYLSLIQSKINYGIIFQHLTDFLLIFP